MKAIWCGKKQAFKTYEGWTETTIDKKGTVLKGLEDVLVFTDGEAQANVLPPYQEWRYVSARVNWRMFK